MTEFHTIKKKLTQLHPKLPAKLQQAAAYILAHPSEIATQSMRNIAKTSSVAPAHFTRLAKALGFTSYNQLRDIYRNEVHRRTIGKYPERAYDLQTSGKTSNSKEIWSSFKSASLQNIEAVYNSIDFKLVDKTSKRLLKCDNIYITGMQASASFANYLNYISGMALPNIKLIGRTGGIIADDLVEIGTKDALICISIQPCARTTIQVAELAYHRKAYVVGITDSLVSPLAQFSTEILQISCESPLFFESYVGVTALIELLVGFLTVDADSGAVKRIKKIEKDRHLLLEYWNNNMTKEKK